MNDDTCQHVWGEAEECETRMGLMRSPVCTICGALKAEVDQHAHDRAEQARNERAVHAHQVKFFENI